MTEVEWLKQQSGLTDDELKAMEAVAGHAKFVGMLQKLIGENTAGLKAKADAEQARLDYERRHEQEVVPEMRRVTEEALRATGEAARLKAELDKAREYGIVPEADKDDKISKPPPTPRITQEWQTNVDRARKIADRCRAKARAARWTYRHKQ